MIDNSRRTRAGGAARLVMAALGLAVVLALASCGSLERGTGASPGGLPPLYARLNRVLTPAKPIAPSFATVIYSDDGVVLARLFTEDRTYVPIGEIPKALLDATVAIEDSRFYSHSGVDPTGIARAAWQNAKSGRYAQGGSTITQQLVRNVMLSSKKTIERKVEESVLAVDLEREFTKDEILELYLNHIYYGSGAYGVEAASQAYFGKSVGRLNLSECALLAGLAQNPSGYSPHRHLDRAIGRRNVVLKRMLDLGKITSAEQDAAKASRIRVVPRVAGPMDCRAPHFVACVIKELRKHYSRNELYSAGLQVYTTLDYRAQLAAEKALRSQGRLLGSVRASEGCLVCLDSRTGYVRAMVGSVDPASEFNRCAQGPGRQPGSTFKLFVYAAALEAGLEPSDTVLDGPVSFPGAGGKTWQPRNYDGRFHGTVTLTDAIAQSINIPAIKVADRVGIDNVLRYARAMGVRSDIEPCLPAAIGGADGIHPVDMASAYGTVANGGVYVAPLVVVSVRQWDGRVLREDSPSGERVLSERTNESLDQMLRSVVVSSAGTGRQAGRVPEARGKTGTTSRDRDAWFVGYVPGGLVAACWVGNDDDSPMVGAYGGSVCAKIWRRFMLDAAGAARGAELVPVDRDLTAKLMSGLPSLRSSGLGGSGQEDLEAPIDADADSEPDEQSDPTTPSDDGRDAAPDGGALSPNDQ